MSDQSEERVSFKQGGGWLVPLGLAIVCVGVVLLFLGFTGRLEGEPGDNFHDWGGLAFGVPAVLLGLCVALERRGQIIDRAQGVAVRWWGFPVAIVERRHRLTASAVVCIGHKMRNCAFPVSLKLPGREIQLGAPEKVGQSFSIAKQVATLLNTSVQDESSGTEIEHSVESLEQPLRERLAANGVSTRRPSPPADRRVEITEDADGATFTLPPLGWHLRWVVPKLFVGVVLVAMGLVQVCVQVTESKFAPQDVGEWARVAVLLASLVLAPLVVFVRQALVRARLKERVTVTRNELRIHTSRFVGTQETVIPLREVMGLQVCLRPGGPPNTILAWSRRKQCTFGMMLNDDERAWLVEALRHVIAGGR